MHSRCSIKYPWHGEMSQGMLDTAETLARETGETIRRSRAMDQMRIERRVTTGFRGLRVPARTGRILFRIGGRSAQWDFVISCREIESDRGRGREGVDRR